MGTKYQYILFDLDGTLTDPKAGITRCVQYALRSFGIEEPDLGRLEPFIGPPLRESFMERYGFTAEMAEEATARYRERFAGTGIYENEIYPGIPDLLRELKQAGRRLAVASSKPEVYVHEILRHFGIADYFRVVTGSELNGTRDRKEEVVAETLKRLFPEGGADLDHTVMAGDRKYDVEGARANGIRAIGAAYGYAQEGELQAAGADAVAESVEELRRLLLEP